MPRPDHSTALPAPGQDRLSEVLAQLAHAPAVLVQVTATQGSVPREAGTWMAVFARGCIGTIGGGHLEYEAMARARALLANNDREAVTQRFALGPSLGQCCGGVVFLQFRRVDAADRAELQTALAPARWPVALFGGGHVGQALVDVLGRLPVALHWIDSRDGVFPDRVPAGVVCEHAEPVQSAVRDLPAGARVLVMSFSHAEDLDIVATCLLRQREKGDLPFIGLIGSNTKWATFRHRLEARGFTAQELAQVTCPIGVAGIPGKEPEVIAVAVAAQLLQSVYAG
ncbi:MAG: xanthine dehydrogenase accessory protein XdhC [Haliea sp.]|nr:MAG: xanthine dehydrogenase accessory protein XdhC [Haliea sp.]